jgi:hypothetical protein
VKITTLSVQWFFVQFIGNLFYNGPQSTFRARRKFHFIALSSD